MYTTMRSNKQYTIIPTCVVIIIYIISITKLVQSIKINNIKPRKHITSAYRDLLLLKEEEKKQTNPQIKEERHEISADDKHKFNNLQYKRAADVMNEVRFRNKNTVKHSVKHLLKHKMKIGGCACDFMSGVTATKIVGSTGNCAPKVALCGFCMNAAWAAYWHPEQDTCKQYVLGAKGVCSSIAGGASAAAADIGFLYEKYGPQFGASAVWCREMGCCAMEAL